MIKSIPDHEGYYVTEDGKVLSDRIKGSAKKRGPMHELTPVLNNNGYAIVKLRNNKTGKRDDFLVHRLVGEAFIPNPDNLPEINHKHGVKTDNRVSELEWCTCAENMKHAIDTGLFNPNGENNNNSKLTLEQVAEIRAAYKPWNREFGGSSACEKIRRWR